MRRAAAACCLFAASVLPAAAQSGRSPVEVNVGGGLLGGADLGSDDAELRNNEPGRSPFRLFSAASRIASRRTLHARVLVPLSARVAVEGGLTVSRPDLVTSVSTDAESAAPIDVTERIDQYVIDAGLLVRLTDLRIGASLTPFIAAGAGYLRQLHEGQTVIEHGQAYYAGGGLTYPLLERARGFVRAAGLRADARVYLMRGGVAFDDRPRPHAAISGGVCIGF